ncbi:MAG: DUF6879 family protein [Pseudonocardiaceae bacterium]
MDLAEQDLPEELAAAPGDWWLIDGGDVVTMHYHPDGQFLGAEILAARQAAQHRIGADAAWRAAEPFNT